METRRHHDPLRVPVSPGLSVRKLLVKIVDIFSKSFTLSTLFSCVDIG